MSATLNQIGRESCYGYVVSFFVYRVNISLVFVYYWLSYFLSYIFLPPPSPFLSHANDYVTKLMCRMAPLLGGDLSRRVFLDRFASLCGDGLFHVRKICAANFGEFCSVVGQEITEQVLVSCARSRIDTLAWWVCVPCSRVLIVLWIFTFMLSRRCAIADRYFPQLDPGH